MQQKTWLVTNLRTPTKVMSCRSSVPFARHTTIAIAIYNTNILTIINDQARIWSFNTPCLLVTEACPLQPLETSDLQVLFHPSLHTLHLSPIIDNPRILPQSFTPHTPTTNHIPFLTRPSSTHPFTPSHIYPPTWSNETSSSPSS